MKIFGINLIFIGLLWALFAFNMDTTVENTYNIGLISQQQNYIQGSGITLIVGVMLLIFGTQEEENTIKIYLKRLFKVLLWLFVVWISIGIIYESFIHIKDYYDEYNEVESNETVMKENISTEPIITEDNVTSTEEEEITHEVKYNGVVYGLKKFLSIRDTPEDVYSVEIDRMYNDDTVEIVAENDKWYKIKLNNYYAYGWCHKNKVTIGNVRKNDSREPKDIQKDEDYNSLLSSRDVVDGATAFAYCSACHGVDGKGTIGGAKVLAGLSADDVEAKLYAYKAGIIEAPTAAVMYGQVAALDDATIKALATHIATLK